MYKEEESEFIESNESWRKFGRDYNKIT